MVVREISECSVGAPVALRVSRGFRCPDDDTCYATIRGQELTGGVKG
jgi:hypothetical protein